MDKEVKLIKKTFKESVRKISIDTRTIKKGDIFLALEGENFDGHKFIEIAKNKKAIGAIVKEDFKGQLPENFTVVKVKDTLSALQKLASQIRKESKVDIVAITGTAGKTTTKDMAFSIFKTFKKSFKTQGNLNNLIGAPLSLLKAEAKHEIGVMELGISEKKEMEKLLKIVMPDVGAITNIGIGHTRDLGGLLGVVEEKGKLYKSLKKGSAVVNLDDENVLKRAMDEKENGNVKKFYTYSQKNPFADVFIKSIEKKGLTSLKVNYKVLGEDLTVKFNSPWQCNAYNGACAIALSLFYNPKLSNIKKALESFKPSKGRMEVKKKKGVTFLTDFYNANPSSLESSLKVFEGVEGRHIAMLGDMLELGKESKKEHEKIGKLCKKQNIKKIFFFGKMAASVERGALKAGYKKTDVIASDDFEKISKKFSSLVKANDLVLVKGSRGMKMEEFVKTFGRNK